MGKQVSWTITELVKMFDDRRKNEYDCNVLVTGLTGKGKSSFILKTLSRFKEFKIGKHMIYSREDTIRLLRDQKFSFCWNDELIASGYKREHWNNLQIQLIKILTQYRCNWNIFMAALPVFFTADKEMLKQFSLNVDVIGRGVGILHMRKNGRRYTDDPWDTKYNSKLEESWSKTLQNNPNFRIPYWKYTTYAGHIYWNDITKKQRETYEKIRDKKKAILAEQMENADKKEKPFYENVYDLLMQKKFDDKSLEATSIVANKNPTVVRAQLNKMLKERNIKDRVKDLLVETPIHMNVNRELIENF